MIARTASLSIIVKDFGASRGFARRHSYPLQRLRRQFDVATLRRNPRVRSKRLCAFPLLNWPRPSLN